MVTFVQWPWSQGPKYFSIQMYALWSVLSGHLSNDVVLRQYRILPVLLLLHKFSRQSLITQEVQLHSPRDWLCCFRLFDAHRACWERVGIVLSTLTSIRKVLLASNRK